MRSILLAFGGIVLAALPMAAQEDPAPPARSQQEKPARAPRDFMRTPSEERSTDLWYGTPGVQPGGDLIGPIRDIVRKPSSLLDFRPRKVQPFLPDRETAEFLNQPRWIGEPRW